MKTQTLAFFLAVACMTVTQCKSTVAYTLPEGQTKSDTGKITLEQFHEFDWQRQVETLEAIANSVHTADDNGILASALIDDDDAVIVGALDAVLRLERDAFLPKAIELMQSKDPIIRWHAILVIEKMGSDAALLPMVVKLTSDKEWLVREAAYRTLRKFKDERKNKTHFYSVIFHLNEKNPQVVAEIYRTLVWYDDESAWPYLIKRSYHCKSAAELILVMRELARTKTREAQVRLKTLTRSQSVIVRQEAAEMLREYY